MSFNIIGLGIEKQTIAEIKEKAEFSSCKYFEHKSCEQLRKFCKRDNMPLVAVINIDVYGKQAFTLCAELRERPNTYILFASRSNEPGDRVRWLSLGANSNITIPFYADELIHRATQLVAADNRTIISDKNFTILLKQREVYYNARYVSMTPKAYNLLIYLLDNSGRVISREEILENVFHVEHYLSNRAVDTIVKQLRRAVGFEVLETIRGIGYRYDENIILETLDSEKDYIEDLELDDDQSISISKQTRIMGEILMPEGAKKELETQQEYAAKT